MNQSLISFLTLYKKEVQRFTKIPLQTIAAPAATGGGGPGPGPGGPG